METTQQNEIKTPEVSGEGRKFKMPSKKVTAIIVVVIALALLIYYLRAWFVAATVDGRPVSRLSLIKELERQGGKDTLDYLITRQLVNNEAGSKNITVTQTEVDDEVKKLEEQFTSQGLTLDDALAGQNLTRETLREQIMLGKKIEKLLADRIQITDEEVSSFMSEVGITPEPGKEQEAKDEAREQIRQQKLAEISTQFISELRAKANIKTYITF